MSGPRYQPLRQPGARMLSVIETTLLRRGTPPAEQRQGEPIRLITQYWSLDGQLLAEVDPLRAFPAGVSVPVATATLDGQPGDAS